MADELSPFGKYLKSMLREADLTQADLARALDVEPSHISHIFYGRRGTTIHQILKIAEIIRRPFDEVARAAVGLPIIYDPNEKIERMSSLVADLPEDEQEYYLQIIELRHQKIQEEKAKYDAARKNKKRPATVE